MNLWSVRIDEASGQVLSGPESMTIPNEEGGAPDRLGRQPPDRLRRLALRPRTLRKFHWTRSPAGPATPVPITRGANPFFWQSQRLPGRAVARVTSRLRSSLGGHLVVMRVDGSERRMLTDDSHKDRLPTWSPDGSRIGFFSDRSGRYEIWTILPDGRELRQLTRTGPNSGREGALIWPQWSPDGSRMSRLPSS